MIWGDFPGGAMVKHPPWNAGDTSSTPDPGTNLPHAAGQTACALQPKILHDATKSLCAPTKNQFGQINK